MNNYYYSFQTFEESEKNQVSGAAQSCLPRRR